MLNPAPPFKLASALASASFDPGAADADDDATDREDEGGRGRGRMRLAQMEMHLHCSVIGTCLGTAELRKLMGRFIDAHGASDLDVHHEAVRLAAAGGPVSKALQKLLDQRHGAVIRRFAAERDAAAIAALWEQALKQGEVPGAYWAALTHRDASSEIRQRVFGDVHMLSHLVGAANRADIRRLVELERDNAALQDRLDRQQLRLDATFDERDRAVARAAAASVDAAGLRAAATPNAPVDAPAQPGGESALSERVGLQTARRERAEQALQVQAAERARLEDELAGCHAHIAALGQEVTAAEAALCEADDASQPGLLGERLRGSRILYVGGRPSSATAIRDLVRRHGGEIRRHDGGLEDRKGLLGAGVAWSALVVFPVDCVDHDSASNLKRLCQRLGRRFLPLRSAGVASFAAALGREGDDRPPDRSCCARHG